LIPDDLKEFSLSALKPASFFLSRSKAFFSS
jgi:hypothetical protein